MIYQADHTLKDYSNAIRELAKELLRGDQMSQDVIRDVIVATIRADEGIYRLMRMYYEGR